MYLKGLKNGALGGKILGAGGGGFMLFIVEPNNKKKFIDKFKNVLNVPVKIDTTGSQIVYYSR